MTRERTTEQRLTDWLVSEAPTEIADRVLAETFQETSATRQVRALPGWRTFPMDRKVISFAAGAAAIAVVVIAGAAYFGQGGTSSVGAIPSTAPTPTPTPEESLAPGISGWVPYSSAVNGFGLEVPAGWSSNPATRTWQAGDTFPAEGDGLQYADVFLSPEEGDGSVGLFVWRMPTDEGADLGSVEGLKAVADSFCDEIGRSSCEDFTQRAEPMCLDDDGGSCRPAIFVPTADPQYAFFRTWGRAILSMNEVVVIVVGREDDHPSVARYGGSEALLKAILNRIGVTTPQRGQVPSD